MRLVDADEFYKELERIRQEYLDENTMACDFAANVIETVQDEYLANAPTIEAAPIVHARWDGEGDGYSDGEIVIDVWYCSSCNYCIDDGTDEPGMLPNYCPECGAKMDGGDGNGI